MSKVRQHTCCNKEEVKMGAWSPEEDEILRNHILANGLDNWTILPQQAGLRRCAKSCRLRWMNYLRPDLKRGPFSVDETHLIVRLHERVGNKWSYIATQLPGRSDNEIKNFWNTTLKKGLIISPELNQQNLQAADSINNNPPPPPPPPQQQYHQQQMQQQLYMNLFYSLKQRFFDSAAYRLINNHDHNHVAQEDQEVRVQPAAVADLVPQVDYTDHVAQEDQEMMAQEPEPEPADQSLIVPPDDDDDDMPSDDLIKECLQVYNQFFPPTSSPSPS